MSQKDAAPEAGSLLAGYLDEDHVSAALGRTKRCLRALRARGEGPPYVKVLNKILYPADEFRAWLKSIEQRPVRSHRAA